MRDPTLGELSTTPPLRELLHRRYSEGDDSRALLVDRPGEGQWLSYADLGRAVMQLADGLAAEGAVPGARVGVMLPNSAAFVRAWLALIELDATMVPVNINLVGTGLRHVLLGSDLDLLIVEPSLLPAVRAACGGEAAARRVIEVTSPPPWSSTPPAPPAPQRASSSRARRRRGMG